MTLSEIWLLVSGAIGGFILIVNGAEKLVKVYKAAKAPNVAQDNRLDKLEGRMNHVESCLDKDKRRLDSLDEGNRVTQRALLALLDHALDGNNVDQMRTAKEDLKNHLINR